MTLWGPSEQEQCMGKNNPAVARGAPPLSSTKPCPPSSSHLLQEPLDALQLDADVVIISLGRQLDFLGLNPARFGN